MNKKNTSDLTKVSYFWLLFIMIQPLLDLLTSITINVIGSNFTPGIVIRMLVMFLGLYYIWINIRQRQLKLLFYYFLALSIYLIIHIIVNINSKPVFNYFLEFSSIAKVAFFIIFLFVFIFAFLNIKSSQYEKVFPFNLVVSLSLINLVMILSTVTSSGFRSYGALYRTGHSGWFNAANDLGTTLAISLPILLWFTLSVKYKKNIVGWVLVGTTILSMLVIGTKVGYLAILISLFMAFTGMWLHAIFIDRGINKSNIINGLTLLIMFSTIIAYTPNLPAFSNTTEYYSAVKEKNKKENERDNGELNDKESEENNEILNTVIYSGRKTFEEQYKTGQNQSNNWQLIFGKGYAGNYSENPKLIERDFHDIYYQFGPLGFFLIFLVLFFALFKLVIKILFNIKYFLNVKYFLLGSSALMGLGISFIAGHTITSPGVSIYLTLVLSYLIVDLNLFNLNTIDKVRK